VSGYAPLLPRCPVHHTPVLENPVRRSTARGHLMKGNQGGLR
jgi:hypothetical protein